MADPASLTGLATTAFGAAWKAVKTLAELKKAVPRIGETMDGVQLQVEGMYQILDGLTDVLAQPGFESHLCQADSDFTKLVPATIKSCGVFLQRVKSEADQIQRSKKPGLLGRTLMAAKYQWSKNEIRELLEHVTRHSVNLQLATNIVNLYRPLPSQELKEIQERLEQAIEALRARMDDNADSIALANDRYLMDIKIDECTEPLMQCAVRALSRGSSATERQSSGARSIRPGQPAFQYIDEAIIRRTITTEWLDDPTPQEQRVDLPVSTPSSQWEPPRSIFGRSERDHRPSQSPLVDSNQPFYIPSDNDRSISLENVTEMCQEGEYRAEREDWMRADQELTGALNKMRGFSDERRERLHYLERSILHGRCKMELGEYDAAAAILTDVINSPDGASRYQSMRLQALYVLATLSLRRGKHSTAQEYCRQALRGQEALFGEKDDTSFASLALLSKIMLAMGDPMQAKYYARRLPNNMRAKHIQELNDFSTQRSQLELFPDMEPSLSTYAFPYFKIRETEDRLSPISDDALGKHIYVSTAADFRERTNSATSDRKTASGFPLFENVNDEPAESRAVALEEAYVIRPAWRPPVRDSIAESFQQRTLSMSSTEGISTSKPVPLITPSSLRYDEFVQSKAGNSEEWYFAVEIQAKIYDGESWTELSPFMKIEHLHGTLSLEIGRMNFAHFKGANHPCRRLNEPFFHQIAFWQDGSEPTCECTIEYDPRSHGLCFQSVAGYAWLNGELSANGPALLKEDFRVYLSGPQAADTTPSPRRSSWIAQAKDVEFKVLLQDVQLNGDPNVGLWLKARRDFR